MSAETAGFVASAIFAFGLTGAFLAALWVAVKLSQFVKDDAGARDSERRGAVKPAHWPPDAAELADANEAELARRMAAYETRRGGTMTERRLNPAAAQVIADFDREIEARIAEYAAAPGGKGIHGRLQQQYSSIAFQEFFDREVRAGARVPDVVEGFSNWAGMMALAILARCGTDGELVGALIVSSIQKYITTALRTPVEVLRVDAAGHAQRATLEGLLSGKDGGGV